MKKYYINLDISTDRREMMEKRYPNIIRIQAYRGRYIKRNYTDIVLPSEDKTRRGQLGCSYSHVKAIITAYLNGDSEALIMEDDISDEYSSRWEKSIEDIVLSSPDDCELISLYTNNLQSLKKMSTLDNDFYPWNRYFTSTGCYYINRKGMEKIYNLFYKDGKIDFSVKLKNYIADDGVIYNNLVSYVYTKPTFTNVLFKSTIAEKDNPEEAYSYIKGYFEES